MASAFDELSALLGPSGVLTDLPSLRRCARDSWPQALGWDDAEVSRHLPAAVLQPSDQRQAAACLAWACHRRMPIVPRGAGSGVLGGAIPTLPGTIVVDLQGLDSVEPVAAGGEAPSVTCGAGVLGGVLERHLSAQGWSLRHFPQSMDDSSSGGWVATDSYGQLSTRYGGMKEQVLWVKTALPDGTVRTEAPGPHLGAEGTLGLIVELALRVRPLATTRRFFSWGFTRLDDALDFARRTMERRPLPSVLRLYCPVDSFFNGLRSAGRADTRSALLERVEALVLRGPRALNALSFALGRRWVCVAVYEDEEGHRGGGPAESPSSCELGETPARRWWDRRFHLDKERLERVFRRGCFADTLDVAAPWERLAGLHRAVLESARRHAFAFSHFSHFDTAGACLYVTIAGAGAERHRRAWSAALDACLAAGGRVNHHHGVGLAKLAWLDSALTSAWRRTWSEEKQRRDPYGLLNPGKLCL